MKSPTKILKIRKSDAWGEGHFGAPRGNHSHKGLDLITEAGEAIFSPIDGKITKQGYTYTDDLSYRYVRIENDKYQVDLYYTKMRDVFKLNDEVCEGDHIANAQDIAKRYSTKLKPMINHCHMQVWIKVNKDLLLIDPVTILEK